MTKKKIFNLFLYLRLFENHTCISQKGRIGYHNREGSHLFRGTHYTVVLNKILHIWQQDNQENNWFQVGHKAFRIKMGLLKFNYTQVKKEAAHTKLFQ
jgi:hypothetical protein